MTDERDAYPRRVLGCSGLMFTVTLFRELEKQIRLQRGTGNFIRPPFSLFAAQMTKAIFQLGFASGSPRKGRHQEGDPSSTQLKTKKRHTFVLAMYSPAVISLCLTCCTLYTCKISPPPNSTSFSGWQCSKKSTGKLTVVDFTLVLVAFFLRTGFTMLSGL